MILDSRVLRTTRHEHHTSRTERLLERLPGLTDPILVPDVVNEDLYLSEPDSEDEFIRKFEKEKSNLLMYESDVDLDSDDGFKF